MYVSIRDDVLRQAGYASIAEGLKDLKLDSVEVEFFRDYSVWSPTEWNKTSFAPVAAELTIKNA
ncbi:MAG: hypothetical protein Q7J98_03090 [Kiritimatiellia bacterium]|nr:hypothetical protein [Kiritimatiellia bacterium]